MKRTNSRIKALNMLYQYELCDKDVNVESFDNLLEEYTEDNKKVSIDDKFAQDLFNGVIEKMDTIDRIIAINLDNYPLDRLSYLDRNIIRIGTYELLYTDTPKAIIINEVVEISKLFTEIDDFKTSKFNNSVMDKIAKFIEERKNNGGN